MKYKIYRLLIATAAVLTMSGAMTTLTYASPIVSAGAGKVLEEAGNTVSSDVKAGVAVVEEVSSEEVIEEEIQETIAGYTNLGIAHVENHLNVRETPAEDGKLVGKMTKNAGCEVLDVNGEWAHIKSGKVEGYVNTEFLYTGDEAKAIAQECITLMATVNTTTLFVREQPTTDSAVITMVPIEEELEVLENLDDWYKIAIDDDEGYISAEFVDTKEELAKAVTMEELRYGEGVSDVRVSLTSYAKQFIGNPYVWGGTSLTRGADCSGFTMGVFAKYGISLPHSSRTQSTMGSKISGSEAKPGDLFFYGKGGTVNHVAIYIGGGQVVHASSKKTGIKISNAYYRTPLAVRRLIND